MLGTSAYKPHLVSVTQNIIIHRIINQTTEFVFVEVQCNKTMPQEIFRWVAKMLVPYLSRVSFTELFIKWQCRGPQHFYISNGSVEAHTYFYVSNGRVEAHTTFILGMYRIHVLTGFRIPDFTGSLIRILDSEPDSGSGFWLGSTTTK